MVSLTSWYPSYFMISVQGSASDFNLEFQLRHFLMFIITSHSRLGGFPVLIDTVNVLLLCFDLSAVLNCTRYCFDF